MGYFTNETIRNAVDYYLQSNDIDDFKYDGCTGFEALNLFMDYNEAWELEFVCSYLDIINGIKTPWPKLPELVMKGE